MTAAEEASEPETSELRARVAGLNRAMQACGGGIELGDHDGDGVVSVRLLGMCTGCSCRAVTTVSTIRPMLLDVPGVRDIFVENSRVSRYAEEHMGRAFADSAQECTGDTTGED